MFNKFSFRAKLLALCFFMASTSFIVGIVSYRGVNKVEASYDKVVDVAMANFNTLNDMYLAYRSIRINLRTLGLPGLTKDQANQAIQQVNEAVAQYEKDDKVYNEIPFQPGEQEIYDRVNATWLQFKEVGNRAIGDYNTGTPASREKLMKIFLEDCPKVANEFTVAIEKLKEFHNARGKEHVLAARATAESTNTIVILVSLLGIFGGLIVGYLFSTQMASSISQVAQTLSHNADEVTSASNQIASTSEQLSQATTEQATSLEETAASLNEITSMIARSSENIQTAATNSQESHSQAEEGRVAVDQMLHSMNEISQSNDAILTQVTESNRQMTEIVKVIREIGNKTKVINEIVFQTKLLSFNASVEAARAGEHGKGFAVVAEEVGNLAQMSGNAAKEISEMLENSISKVEGIVDETKVRVESLIHLGKNKVDSGVVVAKQCSTVLDQIVENVSKVSHLAHDIAQANKEQNLGIAEINKAMSQLDISTQQNSATSEEAASAAEELSAQAEAMKSVADELMAVIYGYGKKGNNPVSAQQVEKRTLGAGPHKRGNVVHLKTHKRHTADFGAGTEFKRAAGDGLVQRDDDGFKDI